MSDMVENTEKKSSLNSKQINLLDRAKNKAHLIGHLVGYRDLTELHANWINHFWKARHEVYVLQSHRNSYKTSCVALFIALVLLLRPNDIVFYVRKTETLVKDIVAEVSKIMQTDVFQAFAQIIYGHGYRLVKNTATEIDTSLPHGDNKKVQFIGFGIDAKMTGRHCDWLIGDDLCDINDRNSAVTRERTKEAWRELYANILKPTGRAIAIGTPWSESDVFSIMPKPDKYDCYSTGILSKEQIEEKKRQTTPALFAANYELKFIADEDAVFTNYQILYDKDIGCNLTGKDVIRGGVCHIDAGYFGGDTTAFTILKKTPDGRYLVFGKVWSKHVQACLGEILKLQEKYDAGSIYLETNGDKGYLAKELREQGVRCLTYHEKRNKYEKITNVLLPIWDKVYFIESCDLNYINQIMTFSPYCEHDDAADSLASICYRSEAFKTKAIEGLNI
jgi:hypothetical protein